MLTIVKKQSLALVVALSIAFSPVLISSVAAVEIAPIDRLDPDDLQNDLKDLGTGNELAQTGNKAQNDTCSKSKPSVWSWLTNQSRKPASYHFIDIIEILD